MAHKRRARVRYHSVRGGHYGPFGPRYLGYHMAVRTHRRRRARSRRNPFFSNPGRGGTNWLLIGGVAVGAFFLLRGGALGSMFGGGAPAGYTPLGTSGYYRGPDGQVYTRTATGGMVRSATQFAAGSTVEQQLIQQGIAAGIPLVASGIRAGGEILGDWLGNLFGGGGGSTATGTIPSTADVLRPVESGGLAPLPEIPELMLGDWWSAPSTEDWWSSTPSGETAFSLTELPPLPSVEIAWVDPEFVASEPSGFWGFGGLGRYHHRTYGQVRRGPSGEVEARFMRQPPSYR